MTEPAVAVKLAVDAPAATVTEAGVVNAELLSETVTAEPPVGAAADSVTVQVDVAPEAMLEGEHTSLETTGAKAWTEMLPPVPEIAIAEPSAEDPTTLLISRGSCRSAGCGKLDGNYGDYAVTDEAGIHAAGKTGQRSAAGAAGDGLACRS